MSTTIKTHLSLLVLGEHIYGKRRDGCYFYPGECIESDDIHNANFADGSKESMLEKNLTWLGFWDVPRPKLNSLIQGTVFTSNEFDGEVRNQFVDERSHDLKTKRPASFSLLNNSDDEDDVRLIRKPNCPANSRSSTREQSHCAAHQCAVVHTQPLMTGPRNHDMTQQRSSVLRLNRKALSREIATNNNMIDLNSSTLSSSRKRSTNTNLHPTLSSIQSMAKYIKNRRSDYDFVPGSCTRLRSRIRRNDTQIFERYSDCKAPEITSLHQRHFESEDEFDARAGAIVQNHVIECSRHSSACYLDAPCQSLDWFETPNINQSDPTTHPSNFTLPHPPVRPQNTSPLELSQAIFSSSITLQLPDIGHLVPESKTRTIAIGLGRKRQKENGKKCRKVYGIINRQLWCTQCKWKKACSRFKA